MSNCLSIAASLSQALGPEPKALYVITILGIIAILVLAFRVKVKPAVLDLRNTPGRSSNVGPIHLAAVLVLWVGLQAAVILLLPAFGLTAETATQPDNKPIVLRIMVVSAALAEAALLGACLVAGNLAFRHGLVRGMGLDARHWVYDTLSAIVAVVAIMPIVLGLHVLTSWILYILHVKVELHVILTALKQLPFWWKVAAFIGAAVITPPAEELFFRGLVQTMFRQYLGRPWTAIFITSVFFSSMHYSTPDAIPSLAALSVALGYLYERSGRLWAPILVHALFNGFNMYVQLAGGSGP